VLLLNIWNQVTWSRFCSRLKWLLGADISFGSSNDNFQAHMFIQSPKNIRFLYREKQDVEQLPEGNELASLVKDCAKGPNYCNRKIFNWTAQNHL
jgi:hypothetical protein